MPRKLEAPSLWRPMRTPIFRRLLLADVASDVGTFMQGVGAAWLMVSLGAGPMYVALTQTASTLPFFLLALPAGAIGDIVDRRKLILYTEAWMVGVAIALAAATLTGVMTPWLLLVLTFALSAGDAVETPTWRAVLPELVPKEDLPAASALNGIEFNIARATGPALAGALIAVAGVGAAFLVNVGSFLGVILVVTRWKRPVRRRTAPAETLGGATVAAIRYVRNAPAIRAIVLRSGGSALWGTVGSRASVDTALLWAGLATIATTALGLIARLPDGAADVSPWNHWRMPAIVRDAAPALDQGPVLVTVEYRVDARDVTPFLRAVHAYGRVRRRDGASRWGIFRDLEHADAYLETFLVPSFAEHLRQHERLTRGDDELEQRIRRHTRGEPIVRHLIDAGLED